MSVDAGDGEADGPEGDGDPETSEEELDPATARLHRRIHDLKEILATCEPPDIARWIELSVRAPRKDAQNDGSSAAQSKGPKRKSGASAVSNPSTAVSQQEVEFEPIERLQPLKKATAKRTRRILELIIGKNLFGISCDVGLDDRPLEKTCVEKRSPQNWLLEYVDRLTLTTV